MGSAQFSAPVRYGLRDTPDASALNNATGAVSVALADMDGDGRNDLVAAAACCGLSVFLNHGNGTFAAPIDYPFTPLAQSLATGDFNGDGLPDVAVVGRDNTGSTLRVFLNGSH